MNGNQRQVFRLVAGPPRVVKPVPRFSPEFQKMAKKFREDAFNGIVSKSRPRIYFGGDPDS